MARRFIAPVRLAVGAAIALAGLALLANPASAAVRSTTTTITESAGAQSGAPVTFTANVAHLATPSGTPTGSVTFTVTGASSAVYTCDGGDVATLSPNGSGPGSVATCTFAAGLLASDSPYTVTTVYGGDANYTGSNGTLSAHIHLGDTTTGVVSASNPTVTGQSVSFTATVAAKSPATGTPTGSVTFAINGTGGGSVACDTTGDTVPLSGDTATCSVAAGLLAQYSPYTVSATYSGDSNFATSSGTVSQTVSKQTATIAVTSSVPGQLSTGQPVTFTATVTPSGSGTPTGDVVFTVTGAGAYTATCDGGDTQPLSGLTATCNFAAGLSAKPLYYTVTATLKDPNFTTPVAGSYVQQMVKANTSTTVTGVPSTLIAGETLNFKITIQTQAPATGAPKGQIEWAVCNVHASQCSGSNAPAGGTFPLPTPTKRDIKNSQMVISFSVPGGITPPGLYSVSATFWGAYDYQSSGSSLSYVSVTKVPTTMALYSSSSPVQAGKRLVLRAAINTDPLASPSIGAPTGTVTFTITGATGDTLSCDSGSNVVTISTTNQNQGYASCEIAVGTTTLADSPYTITASYSGDTNYSPVAGNTTIGIKPSTP